MDISKERVDEFPVPAIELIERIKKKMVDHKPGIMDTFYETGSGIQWNNMKLKGNAWLIEKSRKPSVNYSIGRSSGVIRVDIIPGQDKTVLKAYITTDEESRVWLLYIVAFAVGIASVTYLIIDFSFVALAIMLFIEWFLLKVAPKFRMSELGGLTEYYKLLLEEVLK